MCENDEIYEECEDGDEEERYAYTDKYTGLTVYADDEWAEKRLSLSRIAFARAELTTAGASPERKVFALKVLQELQKSYPDQVASAIGAFREFTA